jgi:hypothetical protein
MAVGIDLRVATDKNDFRLLIGPSGTLNESPGIRLGPVGKRTGVNNDKTRFAKRARRIAVSFQYTGEHIRIPLVGLAAGCEYVEVHFMYLDVNRK